VPQPSRGRPAFFVAATAWLLAAALLAGCSPRFDWRESRQPEAGFAAALPGRPQVAVREIAFDHPGGAVRAQMTMLSAGEGATLFAVGAARLPATALDTPAAVAATLDWFAAGLLRNVQAGQPVEAAAPAPAGLGPRPLRAARAFSADGKAGGGRRAHLAVRLYVVDDRLYQLVALGAEGEIPPQALETFFDAFRLLP
jgi:hypothetical protein